MQISLGKIADHVGGILEGDGEIGISGVAKIEEAGKDQITFLANPKYARFVETTGASAVIVPADFSSASSRALIRCPDPYFAFLKAVVLFHPPHPLLEKGIHPTAVVGAETDLGDDLAVGPYVVIGKRCRIGHGTVLMPGTVIGDDVCIGDQCVLHANVCIREKTRIGRRVIIHCGSVVGSDGFGFARVGQKYEKIPQTGIVVIEDDVEIGANVTIDRATLGETRIKRGAKLDNLIQIAHNCTVGEDTVIAAQAGLSGSTHLGKRNRIGGQVGFAGHLTVGDDAAVGAQSGVDKSIPDGEMVFGYPARPIRETMRVMAALNRLPDLIREIRQMRERMKALEKKTRK